MTLYAWQLWIDDQCDDPETPNRHAPKGFQAAKSSQEAIELTLKIGIIPSEIDFDHDLGGTDNAIQYIDWMIENYYESQVPKYRIHSENPIGKANIISKMESWRKSQSMKQCTICAKTVDSESCLRILIFGSEDKLFCGRICYNYYTSRKI